jgi:hypothetical protein
MIFGQIRGGKLDECIPNELRDIGDLEFFTLNQQVVKDVVVEFITYLQPKQLVREPLFQRRLQQMHLAVLFDGLQGHIRREL